MREEGGEVRGKVGGGEVKLTAGLIWWCGWIVVMTLVYGMRWIVLLISRKSTPKSTAPVSVILALAGIEYDWRTSIQ